MVLMENNIVFHRPIFEHRKQYNSTAIIAEDNHGNVGAQFQLVKAFISVCGNNDTRERDYANPIGFCALPSTTACWTVGEISAAFLRPTRHRVVSAIYGAPIINDWKQASDTAIKGIV